MRLQHELPASGLLVSASPLSQPPRPLQGIATAVRRLQSVIELGRTCRDRRKVGLKTPLRRLTIICRSEATVQDLKMLQHHLEDELNLMEVDFRTDMDAIQLFASLNFKVAYAWGS